MNTHITFTASTQASLEQALQINRGLSPIIRGLQKMEDSRAIQDAHQLQQIMIKFLRKQDLEELCQDLQALDNPLREHCFTAIIKSSGILPLVAIAGM